MFQKFQKLPIPSRHPNHKNEEDNDEKGSVSDADIGLLLAPSETLFEKESKAKAAKLAAKLSSPSDERVEIPATRTISTNRTNQSRTNSTESDTDSDDDEDDDDQLARLDRWNDIN